jgi:CheY-like chemotaxis protein
LCTAFDWKDRMSLDSIARAETILIVEDDPWIRTLLAELLTDEGYRVVEADCGTHALEELARGRADLVVLDLKLPNTSGLEVLRALRADPATADLPVLVMSGEVDAWTRRLLAQREQRASGIVRSTWLSSSNSSSRPARRVFLDQHPDPGHRRAARRGIVAGSISLFRILPLRRGVHAPWH